jgi:O-antigen/teichoic acid export membrane protein
VTRTTPSVAGGIASIVSGSIAGQGVVIVGYPLLTRLYNPSEFGLLTVFTSIVGILAVLSTASLETAIPIPGEDREATAVAWAGIGFVGLTALLTGVAGWAVAARLTGLLGVPALAGFWWLVPLTVLALGMYQLLSDWMVRERSYGALGRRNLFQGVGQVSAQAALGFAGAGPGGLLLGLGVGRLCALGGLLSRRGLLRQPWPGLASVRDAVVRFRRFPLLAAPSTLLNSAGLDVPILIISAIYGDARAGLLGLTVRVVGTPSAIIGQAVYQVFTGESGARLRQSDGMLGSSVRAAALRLCVGGLLPAMVLIAAGPQLFGFVFGQRWVEAGDYARLLAVAYLAQFVVTPVASTLFLLERQGQQLGWAVVRLTLTAGGPIVCGALHAPIKMAIIGLACGHVLSYLLLYVLCVRAADASDRTRLGRP